MINFNFSIRNPWRSHWDSGTCWSGDISQNKFWEFQLMETSDIINLGFNLTHRQDHAGLDIEIGIIGYNARFNIYDKRHWDCEKGSWVVYSNGGN